MFHNLNENLIEANKIIPNPTLTTLIIPRGNSFEQLEKGAEAVAMTIYK